MDWYGNYDDRIIINARGAIQQIDIPNKMIGSSRVSEMMICVVYGCLLYEGGIVTSNDASRSIIFSMIILNDDIV